MSKIDWRSRKSDHAKLELIGKSWGDQVDTYLWYEITGINWLTQEEIQAIKSEFFVSGNAGFGDIELHQSRKIPGGPTILRLRGVLYLRPDLVLRGTRRPLYQVGHGFDDDCLNFFETWKEEEAA